MLFPRRKACWGTALWACSCCIQLDAQPAIAKEKIPAGVSGELRDLIETLYFVNAERRVEAMMELAKLGPKAAPAAPFLIGLLRDDASLVGMKPEYAKELIQEDIYVLSGGGKIYFPGAEQSAAENALARIGVAAIGSLKSALKDPAGSIRSGAITALALMQAPAAVEVLLAALKDPKFGDRAKAAASIGYAKDARVLEILLGMARDRDAAVREGAARGLGRRKDPKGIGVLVPALKDENKGVREAAASALQKITGQEFGDDAAKWEEWWSQQPKF
jgi:HEAT repeat protein